MGRAAPKYSIITKLMLRYFISLEALMERLPAYWNKNYSVGSLSGRAVGNSVFISLRDFMIPPSLFPYLEGYFAGVMGMVIGNHEKIRVEKTERMHGGDRCYELVLSW